MDDMPIAAAPAFALEDTTSDGAPKRGSHVQCLEGNRRTAAGWLCFALVILYWLWPASLRPLMRPAHPVNQPNISVYFGNGCFWHTQYDMAATEMAWGRAGAQVTALVGYAGSAHTSPEGLVCYHGGPSDAEYGDLGFGEGVEVELSGDAAEAQKQYAALLAKYFASFTGGMGKRQRLDPQDRGAEYRCMLGLWGGTSSLLYPLIAQRNAYKMPLEKGKGGPDDTEGEYTVYVYDSQKYPFYRGEQYHQFHSNPVIGRPLPSSYLRTMRSQQIAAKRIDQVCAGGKCCPESRGGFDFSVFAG